VLGIELLGVRAEVDSRKRTSPASVEPTAVDGITQTAKSRLCIDGGKQRSKARSEKRLGNYIMVDKNEVRSTSKNVVTCPSQ
jgi:hypothetical protein